MGIFDFIKKITRMAGNAGNGKADEKNDAKKKIAFSEIENWIENKRKETETREKQVFALIQERIKSFSKELEEKIKVLKNVSLESKKAEVKVKSVAEEGKKKYIEFTELLTKKLNNLQEDKLEKVFDDINNIFLEFNKHSHMSYEKATIFIGKEMNDVKEELVAFSGDLLKISDENKDIINHSKLISLIKLKLKQFDEIEMDIDKINAAITHLDKKIANKLDENKMLLKEIEITKKSPEYLKYLEKEEKIKLTREDLEKDFISLKQLIDFKALANFYHIFEDKMKILNSCKDDFQAEFQKDN